MISKMEQLNFRNAQPNAKARSFADICWWRGLNQPEKIAYRFLLNGVDDYEEINYGDLLSKVASISQFFSDVYNSDERAILVYPSGLEYIAAFYACLYAGVIAVPAYPMLSVADSSRLISIYEDCSPKYILTTSELEGRVHVWLQKFDIDKRDCQVFVTDKLTASSQDIAPLPNPGEIAFLQYTSGSTGKPKGVIVSNANLLYNSETIYKKFGHDDSSQVVSWLPPFHDMGLVGGILQAMYGGFPSNIMSPLTFLRKPQRWIQAVSYWKATSSGGPNFGFKACVKHFNPKTSAGLDLSSWVVAFNGAEPVRPETLKDFFSCYADFGFDYKAFYPCYGLAETTLFVSGSSPGKKPPSLCLDRDEIEKQQRVVKSEEGPFLEYISSGSIIDNKVCIVDPQSGEPLGDCKVGEIWVSGNSVAKGYWNKGEQSNTTFFNQLTNDCENFLRTGDLGFLDDGELYITGRLKELIIINGRNLYPSDIENLIQASSIAFRQDCGAAFSVELEGKEKLIVVQEIERSKIRTINLQKLREDVNKMCLKELSLVLGELVFVEQSTIPKTTSGKVMRLATKNNYIDGSLTRLAVS